MKKNINRFGVTSKYFEVYEAYKTIVEEIGYVYNEKFSAFIRSKAESASGLWFDINWSELEPNVLGFSFSGFSSDNKVFNLDTQFEEAVGYAEYVYEEYHKLQHVFEYVLGGEYVIKDALVYNAYLNKVNMVELVCKNYTNEKDLMFCWRDDGEREKGLLVVGKYNI